MNKNKMKVSFINICNKFINIILIVSIISPFIGLKSRFLQNIISFIIIPGLGVALAVVIFDNMRKNNKDEFKKSIWLLIFYIGAILFRTFANQW